MRCEETPARLADFLATGALPDSARRELEEHAQTCRACREELQNASDMWRRLGATADVVRGHDARGRDSSDLPLVELAGRLALLITRASVRSQAQLRQWRGYANAGSCPSEMAKQGPASERVLLRQRRQVSWLPVRECVIRVSERAGHASSGNPNVIE